MHIVVILRTSHQVLANSSNIVTRNITIHSSSGFTIFELDGECGHVYDAVQVVRRPGYMISSNADIFHTSDCKTGATIVNSLFEAGLDDYINIHSTVHVGWRPAAVDPAGSTATTVAAGATKGDPVVEMYIIQPRLSATSETVNRSVTEEYYGNVGDETRRQPLVLDVQLVGARSQLVA